MKQQSACMWAPGDLSTEQKLIGDDRLRGFLSHLKPNKATQLTSSPLVPVSPPPLGVFITKGDVGVGTIVGSAVFNILVIIGLSGIFAGQVWKKNQHLAYSCF